MSDPIVLISSYPPRLCNIATFTEEAREFIQKHNPGRDVVVICHTDGAGEEVHPIIDLRDPNWWRPVAEKVEASKPYVVHIQHDYSLYEYIDAEGYGDKNMGFLQLLRALEDWPLVVEAHTVHGRLTDYEAGFIRQVADLADVVIFKCHYQKWRLEWTFSQHAWAPPVNVMIIPHGARPDRRWSIEAVPQLRAELGLDNIPGLSRRLVGLVDWIQSNKRWDIVLNVWEEVRNTIYENTGEWWDLLAAGSVRDPKSEKEYRRYRDQLYALEQKGMAYFYEFMPRGDIHYKVMAVCDYLVLPTTDETNSGALSRIIALNKPFLTTAPMEGLTSTTLESAGGLLFTTRDMLKQKMVKLACRERLRMRLGDNLRDYLDNVVSWDIVARQYNDAYRLARESAVEHRPAVIGAEF